MIENILRHNHHVIALIVMAIIAKLLPSTKNKEHFVNYNFNELEIKFKGFDWIGLTGVLVFPTVIIFFLYSIIEYLDKFHFLKNSSNNTIQLGEYNMIFCFCVFITFWGSLSNFFMKYAMGNEKFELYNIYSEMKYGVDPKKFIKWWYYIFGVVSIITLIYLENWYIKFNRNNIEYNTFLEFSPKIYNYNQIKKLKIIKYIPKGILYSQSHSIAIEFNDSNTWDSNWGIDENIDKLALIKFLSEKSKLKIDSISALF